jgi:hypothetical protein
MMTLFDPAFTVDSLGFKHMQVRQSNDDAGY